MNLLWNEMSSQGGTGKNSIVACQCQIIYQGDARKDPQVSFSIDREFRDGKNCSEKLYKKFWLCLDWNESYPHICESSRHMWTPQWASGMFFWLATYEYNYPWAWAEVLAILQVLKRRGVVGLLFVNRLPETGLHSISVLGDQCISRQVKFDFLVDKLPWRHKCWHILSKNFRRRSI